VEGVLPEGQPSLLLRQEFAGGQQLCPQKCQRLIFGGFFFFKKKSTQGPGRAAVVRVVWFLMPVVLGLAGSQLKLKLASPRWTAAGPPVPAQLG
jgi:hypothetical protein